VSKIRNDGGKAFPGEVEGGMTLRDYFAAKAMEACIIRGASTYYALEDEKLDAIWRIADKMLEWRDK
jgi:hypothetical protein